MTVRAETQIDLSRVDDGVSPTATVNKVGDTATITITDGNGTTTAQVLDGSNGSNGVSVTSVKPQYYLSTSSSQATGGSWSDTPQTFVSGKYYWTRDYITYSDGSNNTSTAVYNAGMTKAAQDALDAKTIASDLNQYFWFEPTGNDTGAHISEVPQDEWSDSSDPNYHSGSNMIANSNGIAVRDGMTEVAQFGSNGIVFGNPTDGEVEITASGGRVDLTVENSNNDGAELSLMAGNFWLRSLDTYVGINFKDNDSFGNTYYSTEIMTGPANGYYFTQDGPHNTLPNMVLWNSTPVYLTDQQTINLDSNVSEQWSGIVLVWSRYANGQAQNDSWAYQYIPKWHTANRAGEGVYFSTPTSLTSNTMCNKYVYVYDTYLTGHASNSASGTGYANNTRVLRAVLGV